MHGSEMSVVDTSILVSILRNETQNDCAQRAARVVD